MKKRDFCCITAIQRVSSISNPVIHQHCNTFTNIFNLLAQNKITEMRHPKQISKYSHPSCIPYPPFFFFKLQWWQSQKGKTMTIVEEKRPFCLLIALWLYPKSGRNRGDITHRHFGPKKMLLDKKVTQSENEAQRQSQASDVLKEKLFLL